MGLSMVVRILRMSLCACAFVFVCMYVCSSGPDAPCSSPGTIPAMFGTAMASYVLCKLGGQKLMYEPCRGW